MENDNNKDSSNFTKMLIIIALVVVIVSLYFIMLSPSTKKPASRGSIRSEEQHAQKHADIGGVFSLTDQYGKEFKSEYLLGKPALVYFGFTYCPDVCPTSLQKLTNVMDILDKYKIDVNPIFITIDPKRDTIESLKLYLTNFHSKFIALTGTQEEIKKVADLYKVYYEIIDGSDKGNNDYLLNHTSFIYLMDKNGNYIKHFDISAHPEEIIEFIRINFK